MKKLICLLLAAALLAGTLAGCAPKGEKSAFSADNEIVTYRAIDPEKTQIVVSRTGNIPVEQLCSAFEAYAPDVQVIYIDITGGNQRYMPLKEWIQQGDLPDVVISSSSFFDEELTVQYFENLSDNPIIQEYESAALLRTATNGYVYWLPGPSNLSAMVYNKTLFDQYGWEKPATFDEFVALCDRIRADTNGEIEPWNPNAKYSDELLTAIEAFIYAEALGGIENRTWYDRFLQGEATLSEHMGSYIDVLQTLADHDILREEHFSYSATTRGKEFAAGKIAMINGNVFNGNNDEFLFELMPFPTTKGELGYICDEYSCFVGVPSQVHTDAENEAISRFLAFFSSAEGQTAYIGDTMKLSNIKNVSLSESATLAGLQETVNAGHVFGRMGFPSPSGRSADLHGISEKVVAGTMSAAEALQALDATDGAEQATEKTPETLALVTEDMTILETSFLMADAYRDIADADIGLIAHNEVYRGNMMRLYAGDITDWMIPVFKPRSFANDATLVKVSMTGSQIRAALDHPVGNDSVSNSIYAFSGLKCEIAPRNEPGEKYLSVKLANGSSLEPDERYSVAFWAGTVADEYITETPETFEGSWETLMTEWVRSRQTLSPIADGRYKLVWA